MARRRRHLTQPLRSDALVLAEFVEQILDVVLLSAERLELRGPDAALEADLFEPIVRRLAAATCAPWPVAALYDEARMTYAAALSIASITLRQLSLLGVTPQQAVCAVLEELRQ